LKSILREEYLVNKLINTLVVNKLGRLLLFFSLPLFLVFGTTCTNDLNNVGSDNNPSGAGIILVNINPSTTFGNGSATDSLSQVQVITQELPDGSTIQFQLNSRSLPTLLRGCLINADTVLHDGGQAFAEYLPGIVIGPGGSSTPPPPATLNIAAIITTPQGVKQQNFGTVILNAVNVTPPTDTDVTTNPADSCSAIFLTLQFQTTGIPPGTPVNFKLSNPALGSLKPTSTTVGGSESSGTATTEYDTKNNTGGTQVITATIVLPNPFDIDSNCPDVSIGDRTIQAIVTITQSVPAPTPAPTPGGTPSPAPTCPP
jgi:hypothetical protein